MSWLTIDAWLEPGNQSPLRRETFKLAIVLLYTSGLRRGELLRLVIASIDRDYYSPLEVAWMNRGGYSDVFLEHHPVLGWLGVPGRVARHHTTELDVEIAIGALGWRQADRPRSIESMQRTAASQSREQLVRLFSRDS